MTDLSDKLTDMRYQRNNKIYTTVINLVDYKTNVKQACLIADISYSRFYHARSYMITIHNNLPSINTDDIKTLEVTAIKKTVMKPSKYKPWIDEQIRLSEKTKTETTQYNNNSVNPNIKKETVNKQNIVIHGTNTTVKPNDNTTVKPNVKKSKITPYNIESKFIEYTSVPML